MSRLNVAAAVAVLAVAAVFVADNASANPSTKGTNASHWNEGACDNSLRISHSDSDCLHGWWDNTPPASTGVAFGSTWGAQSSCSQYGQVIAHVDLISTIDMHFHLWTSDKERDKVSGHDVRDISCCMQKSALCLKNEVEADDDGYIRHYTGTGKVFRRLSVATHQQRYDHCQDHSDSIYCTQNPSGDAHDEPEAEAAPELPAESLQHCYDNWEQSEAYTSDDCTSVSIYTVAGGTEAGTTSSDADHRRTMALTDSECHVGYTRCTDIDGYTSYARINRSTSATYAVPLDDMDDITWCSFYQRTCEWWERMQNYSGGGWELFNSLVIGECPAKVVYIGGTRDGETSNELDGSRAQAAAYNCNSGN